MHHLEPTTSLTCPIFALCFQGFAPSSSLLGGWCFHLNQADPGTQLSTSTCLHLFIAFVKPARIKQKQTKKKIWPPVWLLGMGNGHPKGTRSMGQRGQNKATKIKSPKVPPSPPSVCEHMDYRSPDLMCSKNHNRPISDRNKRV